MFLFTSCTIILVPSCPHGAQWRAVSKLTHTYTHEEHCTHTNKQQHWRIHSYSPNPSLTERFTYRHHNEVYSQASHCVLLTGITLRFTHRHLTEIYSQTSHWVLHTLFQLTMGTVIHTFGCSERSMLGTRSHAGSLLKRAAWRGRALQNSTFLFHYRKSVCLSPLAACWTYTIQVKWSSEIIQMNKQDEQTNFLQTIIFLIPSTLLLIYTLGPIQTWVKLTSHSLCFIDLSPC